VASIAADPDPLASVLTDNGSNSPTASANYENAKGSKTATWEMAAFLSKRPYVLLLS